MINIALQCARQSMIRGGRICLPLFPANGQFELAKPLGPQIEEMLAAHGWSTINGEHYCPHHTPALDGFERVVTREYIHLGRGVYARLNLELLLQACTLEVQIRAIPDENQEVSGAHES